MREAMVMRQQRHPNVLPLLAAFLSEAVLWMVMPYVAGGSAIHILNKRCPGVSSMSSCILAQSVLQLGAHTFPVHIPLCSLFLFFCMQHTVPWDQLPVQVVPVHSVIRIP